MPYLQVNKIIVFFLLFLGFACSYDSKELSELNEVYLCNAESMDESKHHFLDSKGSKQGFGNIDRRTNETAQSGEYSIKLIPKSPYGFTTDVKGIGPDEYLRVTAWRKNQNNSGVIVIDGGDGFYNAGKFVVEKKADGWEKIFLEVFTPPTFTKGQVKVFVWNNSPDSVYFDDLQIEHRKTKDYPVYEKTDGLQLYIDDNDLRKLNDKRYIAFETGVLVNNDEDYSNVVLFDGSDFLDAKFRLKGDLVDHIRGDKWSFRFKLKKGFTWKHLKTFSVQNPITRNFLDEWLAHQIFEKEDVLTTRYGFVPVNINNRSLGIYAWEEHFEKQLVESRNRREGPILRFDETLMWQRVLETNVTGREWNIDYFGAAPVIPFKVGQVTADSLMLEKLEEGQKLLYQYKNRTKPVSRIFDLDKLAQYYALVDITQSYHGFTWHNQRFYFNPVTCLLEPIAFDGYIEGGVYKRFDEKVSGMFNPESISTLKEEELMLMQVFSDSLFNLNYLHYLEKYSSSEFIKDIITNYKNQADSLNQLIQKEFPYYQFNFESLTEQAKWVRENLAEIKENVEKIGQQVVNENSNENTSDLNKNLVPLLVHAYYDREKQSLQLLNYHNAEIKVLGAFMKDRMPESFDPAPVLPAYKADGMKILSVPLDELPERILFSVGSVMLETEVYPWKYSEGLSTRQALEETPQQLTLVDGKIIFDGEYVFSNDIFIPETVEEVQFNAGTRMDFVHGAAFISLAPVKMLGSQEKPIKIYSSDHSAQGFNVIQPGEKSKMNFVQFSGLGSMHKGGWQSPAAVALYEADVEMENCIFASNFNCDDALNIVRSQFHVQDCRFENTFADAFDSDFCSGKVVRCTFNKIGNDAIDFSGSHVDISGCTMYDISDKAISGGEHSFLNITECIIDKANIGVASKDMSELELDRIEMSHIVYGLVAFVKKPEYGAAQITINNLRMKNNMIFHQIEEGSVLILNGEKIYGREKNIAEKLYQ
ncbi:CotH kinase family protein [uncultured Draconibacterium sp.]|uniref:CotH kinase family protein n=1 Tax=uncultured Draconibacterium sp. TaxID=1573823 RepID=UPI0025EBFF5D|nr:CotH kinase family protein [uncultured Draconibacterium sp.]